MKLMIFVFMGFLGNYAFSQDVPFFDEGKIKSNSKKLSSKNIDQIASIIHSAVPAANLKCQIKMRQLQQIRKFTTGEQYIESLEIEYTNNASYGGIEMKTYFPVGSALELKKVNSEFSGVVEEITLHANDRLEHFITIQHDGMGHLIWATMGNIFMVNPCQLK